MACTPRLRATMKSGAHGLLIELRKLMFCFDYLAHELGCILLTALCMLGDEYGLNCLNDLHKAAGGELRHAPKQGGAFFHFLLSNR